MTWRILSLALLACTATSGQPAAARVVSMGADAVFVAESPASILRSAFYLRGSGLDQAALDATADERRFHLQRHFDVVLAALLSNGDRSLDVALNRLQHARGEFWTAAERDAWRLKLADQRQLNIRRLRLYQLRGQFPQNEHTASRAVPIFVDYHDTACAVGHLMRESGWSDAVAAIQQTNNFVYVTDIRDGALVDWVLVSGLTQEEAALIQPSYYPPIFDAGLDELTQGGSITRYGLHFDNFHFIAGELDDPDSFPDVPPPANQVPLAGYGAAVRQGVFQSFFSGTIESVFNDWLFTGARNEIYSIYPEDDPWGILFSYDVMPVDPQHHLVAASLESFRANYNFVGNGRIEIDTSIYAGGTTTPLAVLSIGAGSAGAGLFTGEDSASLGPQQKITVVTAVLLEGAATFTSLVHSFQMAPEPSTASLIGLGCVAAIALRRRRAST